MAKLGKFIVTPNKVTFELYMTERYCEGTPCRTIVGANIPNQPRRNEQGLLRQGKFEVKRETSAGPGRFRVWLVTAYWNRSLQRYVLGHIQLKRDEPGNPDWHEALHTIGWVDTEVNNKLDRCLGFRIRPNTQIAEHVGRVLHAHGVERRMLAGAIRYHRSNGLKDAEILPLIRNTRSRPQRDQRSRTKGYANKKPFRNNKRNKHRHTGGHQRNQNKQRINTPFDSLYAAAR